MCVFILAEYTTIGTIFSDFVNTVSWPIIVIVGVVTLMYTAYGGLAVSIATDQAQGVASMILGVMMAIYVAVTYRYVTYCDQLNIVHLTINFWILPLFGADTPSVGNGRSV